MLILKTIGFFFLAMIASIPFGLVTGILGGVIGAGGREILHYIFVGGITLYPLYEHFFIRKRRDSYNNQERIKAYYEFYKRHRYTQSVRGIILFVIAFILSILLTVAFAVISYAPAPNEILGIFLVSLIILNFLLRQYVFFGLPENLSAAEEDEIKITESDYNNIEEAIIAFNRKRRYYLVALIAGLVVATLLLVGTGMPMIIYALIFFFTAIGVAHLNMSMKHAAESIIFPHITDTKDVQQREKFKLTTAMLRSREDYIKADRHAHHPSVIHPERLDFHFTEKQLERLYYESTLTYDLKDGRACKIWELKLPKTVLMVSIALAKTYDTPLFLTTTARPDIGYPEIPNHTYQFGDIFKIYGEDAVLAYSVMSPVLQENLIKLIGNVNAFELTMQIYKNELLLTMTCGSDLFALGSLFRPITMGTLNKVISEIRLIRGLHEIV